MKVITVNSSPRKPGLSKTALMLRHLVIGMRNAGAEVECFDIQDKSIEYCTACFACFNKTFNETELCIHQDDMTREMLPKWKAANLVVYASPVFFHSVTAKLKTFFERTLPVYVSFNGGTEGAYNPAQTPAHPALAFLAVSGSPEDSAFDDYAKYVQCFEPVAQIYRNGSTLMSLPFCRDRVADVLAATEQAGQELVRDLRVSEATMARIRQPLHDDAAFIAKIATAHQTLLPGHRALMTFPTETKRALRKLPASGASEPPEPVSRRRRVTLDATAAARQDEVLSRLLDAPLLAPAMDRKPAAISRDIAIIGMSGRFASAADLDALWRVLEGGEDLVVEASRWDLRARYAASPGYGRAGGLLPEIDRFDALYFKIGGAEARFMDPQQRIFLEESWRALEDAGYASATTETLRCGVYVGCSDGDYRDLFPRETPPQAFWGNAPSVIPARIAYYLNLHGPAVAIDTACSSALVAIHMACQSLRAGEIDMAIGGGVFVQCTPRLFDAANNAAMLSATGHCHAFDDRADGFVIGEGAGSVILKRLDDAVAAGDHIHGVIRASGINQDGATNGLTAPSAQSQERLMREVHEGFGIDPATIQLVEAHGTGTKLGDPIEFQALRGAFAGEERRAACALGSIKSNIGHAGAAAGIAGLFKLLLAMRHGRIPASLHFDRPNPLLRLEESPFFVNRKSQNWPRPAGQPRRAAVSSFGFSGTNGHMVVEEAPACLRRAPQAAARLVALSGRSQEQLAAGIARLIDYLEGAGPAVDLGNLSFTLLLGRSHRRHRFACVVRDQADLLTALRGFRPDAPPIGADRLEEAADPALLRAGQSAVDQVRHADAENLAARLEVVAQHYRAGADLDWTSLFAHGGYGRLPLPTTVFANTRYWIDEAEGVLPVAPIAGPAPETLVGDILLGPVMEVVALNPPAPAEDRPVILAAPGADPALVQRLRREMPESRLLSLDVTDDDAGLRRALDAAVGDAQRLIWVAPAPHEGVLSAAALLPAQEAGVTLLFRAARALLDSGHGARKLDWTLFTQQTASLHGETTCPDHAAIHGFAGSLAREVERWTLRVADLPLRATGPAGLIAECDRLPMDSAGISFFARLAGGEQRQWYRRRLVPASVSTPQAAGPYRRGGVYVVLGGAGGIGRSWSEHVLRTVQAQLVWIGRRPLDGAIIAEQDRLAQFGPRPLYLSADGENTADLLRARDEITARFGAVHGLVHSAILLRDGVVATLDRARFQEALRPKVDLSIKMMEVFAEKSLDFVLFFSSMIAFTPAAGQSNYAAGCAFKDAFAERLGQDLACPVKVMNWGYWGEVGVVSGAEYRARMAGHGMASITAAPAMQALDRLLTQGQDRLAFMATSRSVNIPEIDQTQRLVIASGPMSVTVQTTLSAGVDEIQSLRPQLSVLRDIETAVAPLVRVQLARVSGPVRASFQAWCAQTDIFLSRAPAGVGGETAEVAWQDWDRLRASWRDDADRHARCELVDATLRALPDILTGRVPATDVLFPDGTMRLVEGLYRRNQVADAFNRWMTQILVEDAQHRVAQRSEAGLRILEIGAGTGGTTAPVLAGLRDAALTSGIVDYTYTDVSSAFLRHGLAEFAVDHPYVTFRTLDIERPPATQGFVEGEYDIVLAANVLHATRRIGEALRHAKTLLKPGGLLLLNELSDHSFLSHLTFGLLDSWWAAEDGGRRLPGGPALSSDAWRAVLHEEGFEAIALPVRRAHLFGQQIVVARSDGTIRHAADVQQMVAVPLAAAQPEPVAEKTRAADLGAIESIVLGELSQILGVARDLIDADEAFADYGLDSLNAVQLAQALNRVLAVNLKTGDLYSHASAARLARHIEQIRPQITQPKPAIVASVLAQPTAEVAVSSDIAIIGMSGRVGSAETLDALWQALLAGHSLVGTTDRWPGEAQSGAFLDDIAGFDPAFFNISGLEARYMDPQQRAFLQESWKAIEDAGYAGDAIGRLRDSEVGVFVGCYPSDYFQLIDDKAPAQAMWGAASSVIPARLSYFLDLHGPAVAVDTACSSSLVALHLACQSLISGECKVAIAGGVALHSTPRFFAFAKRAGMLSAGGQCHAFEARADGFVAGEGLGVVVLKPLAQALADGDHIHAVIRGTGVNQDGASNGITAPNGEAQLRLLNKTYAAAGIDPATIECLEAHGTGTKLGDPIEFDALRAHFAASLPGACALGSVKATVGHTLAAAGIVGLIRLLLALRHEMIPPAPDFRAPNPALAMEGSPFAIHRAPQAWPARIGREASAMPRRGAVSSFGFSGTNAHAIIEEAPVRPPVPGKPPAGWLFLLTAASAAQLRQMAGDLVRHCRAHHPDLAAMSFTLLAGRRHLPHRLAWVTASEVEMLQRLEAWLVGSLADGIVSGLATAKAADQDAADEMAGSAALMQRARGLVQGQRIVWEDLFPPGTRRRVPLPTYPFLKDRYWVPVAEPAPVAPPRQKPKAERHPRLLQEVWRPEPLPRGERDQPRRTVILATEQTRPLAGLIARQLPGSMVLDEADAIPADFDADAVIDCAGCGPVAVADLSWLCWPQALARQGEGARYLCLTRGLALVSETDHLASPDGRVSRAALARMLQNEYRKLESAHVDFALDAADAAIAAAVADELGAGRAQSAIAYRDLTRLVSEREEIAADGTDASPIAFPADSALWVTGGTRGLGLLTARHFVARYGVRRLVLTGHRQLPPSSDWPALAKRDDAQGNRCKAYLDLQAQGVALHVRALELTDRAAVGQAVAAAVAELGPIGGLLHCAGTADTETAAFLRKSAEGVGRILSPKTIGLETLWQALAGQPLQLAVLFSSVTAAVPDLAVGQSDYAMANAYLDAFARHRQQRQGRDGRPRVVSLQWPNWKESGMGEVSSQALRQSGFASMTDQEGLALLDRALQAPPVPVLLPAISVPVVAAAVGAVTPVVLAPAATTPASAELEAGPLEAWLSECFAEELEIPLARLQPEVPFSDYGVDSILLTQIQSRLNRALGITLDPSLLYACPSIRSLAQWLGAHHADALAAVVAAPPAPAPAPTVVPPLAVADATPIGNATTEGIAVVGMACRFPMAESLDAYWALIRRGESAIAPISASRPNLGEGGYAALLDEIDLFDPEFFGIRDGDARAMSAQARVVLETSLAALCHAGYRPQEIKGKAIGVYLGARAAAPPPDALLEAVRHPVRAVGQNYLAASVSQFFDLRGPAMVVDTACSSALVAMNSAIQAMRCGDLDMALVGGVNILESDGPLRMFDKRGLSSDSGMFHVFDGRANGLVLGEGCGMVMLKPLSQARAAGDTIYAVVEAVAVNNDGRTAGPSAPNLEAQTAVMQAALRRSGRAAQEITHIEVNGSGNEVSDLLELKAMTAAYGAERQAGCSLGSIKPNIGHPLCAEGIASFIKVVCMLHHGRLPPFLSGEEPMRHFDFATSAFALTRDEQPWREDKRVAAINAFADGGTNAHAILSSWPEEAGRRIRHAPIPMPGMTRRPMQMPAAVAPRARPETGLPARNFWTVS